MNLTLLKLMALMTLTVTHAWAAASELVLDKSVATPRYRITLGKGTSICEALANHFRPQEAM